jgi:hypothetical protein
MNTWLQAKDTQHLQKSYIPLFPNCLHYTQGNNIPNIYTLMMTKHTSPTALQFLFFFFFFFFFLMNNSIANFTTS